MTDFTIKEIEMSSEDRDNKVYTNTKRFLIIMLATRHRYPSEFERLVRDFEKLHNIKFREEFLDYAKR